MTQERFLTFLEDPEQLGRITYQELKTLTLSYPFSANLRTLLVLKSSQVDHPEKGRNLALASLFSPSRTRLFQLMAPKIAIVRFSETAEEVLELKPLATVEQKMEAVLQEKTAENRLAAELPDPFFKKLPDVFSEKKEADQPFSTPIFESEKAKKPAFEIQSKAGLETRFEAINQEELAVVKSGFEPAKSLSKMDFQAWSNQFLLPVLKRKLADNQSVKSKTEEAAVVLKNVEPAAEPVLSKEKPTTPKAAESTSKTESRLEKEREAIVKKLVKASILEKDEIVSETLAKLLIRQGYKEKAAAMYEKLMLVFPEKNATFAAEIEKIGR